MQRPLIGEPLAADLLNTHWRQGGRDVDLLGTADGLAQWLTESGQADIAASERVRATLVAARAAIHGIVEGSPGAEDTINAVLARGLTVRSLREGVVHERVLFADDDWAPAWRAVTNYLMLAASAPHGIRQCDHPDCVLYFFDPTGRRRWCSMAGCGNRAKARRHHARHGVRATPPSAALAAAPASTTGRL